MHSDGDGEVATIDTQLFVGRERETPIFAGRIFNLSQDDVSGNVDPQFGWDEEFRLGCVRVDVVTRRDAEIQIHHGLRGALGRGQRYRVDSKRRGFPWGLRRGRKRSEQRSNEEKRCYRWLFVASAVWLLSHL